MLFCVRIYLRFLGDESMSHLDTYEFACKIYSFLQVEIFKIYQDYDYFKMPYDQFQKFMMQDIQSFLQIHDTYCEQDIVCFLRKRVNIRLRNRLNDEKDFFRILASFICEKLSFSNSIPSLLQAFQKLQQFLEFYEVSLTSAKVKGLYRKSPEFHKLVNHLFESGYPFDDDFLSFSFISFCYDAYLEEELCFEESEETKASLDILKLYYKEIHLPLLTQKEEIELGKRILNGDSLARKTLCERNLKLVVRIAKKYAHSQAELLDFIQEGNIGLMKAVDEYDYRKGYRFSSYASWWIRQAITRFISNNSRMIRLPVHRGSLLSKLKRVSKKLTVLLGREPTLEELALECGVSYDKLKDLYEYSYREISLNVPVKADENSDPNSTLEDYIPSLLHLEEDVIEQDFVERMQEAIKESKLNEKELYVITHFFGLNGNEEQTLKEIGIHFGVTMQRAGQLKESALKKLGNSRKIREQIDFLDHPKLIRERLYHK